MTNTRPIDRFRPKDASITSFTPSKSSGDGSMRSRTPRKPCLAIRFLLPRSARKANMTKERTSTDTQTRQRKADARAFINGLDHSLLRHLARDLIELDFQLGEAHWPRWSCAAFVNGLRLER